MTLISCPIDRTGLCIECVNVVVVVGRLVDK